MKKYVITTVLFIFLALFSGMADKSPVVFTPATVQTVLDHSLAVVTYFEAPQADVDKIIARLRTEGLLAHKLTPGWPMAVTVTEREGNLVVAVIGAATLLRDGYAVTVAHLFQVEDEQGVPLKMMQAWVLQRNTDHPVVAELVAQTPRGGDNPFYNDYAVIRLKENLGLPGVKVAKEGLVQGDSVMFSGSVNGVAFFARFGFVTFFQQFFRKDAAGALHLSRWTSFPLVCAYPGGGGDSGGGVFNTAGELVGVMYCGLSIVTETVVFSNPLAMLKEFLVANKLEN
jgi:hypothetical protein